MNGKIIIEDSVEKVDVYGRFPLSRYARTFVKWFNPFGVAYFFNLTHHGLHPWLFTFDPLGVKASLK